MHVPAETFNLMKLLFYCWQFRKLPDSSPQRGAAPSLLQSQLQYCSLELLCTHSLRVRDNSPNYYWGMANILIIHQFIKILQCTTVILALELFWHLNSKGNKLLHLFLIWNWIRKMWKELLTQNSYLQKLKENFTILFTFTNIYKQLGAQFS